MVQSVYEHKAVTIGLKSIGTQAVCFFFLKKLKISLSTSKGNARLSRKMLLFPQSMTYLKPCCNTFCLLYSEKEFPIYFQSKLPQLPMTSYFYFLCYQTRKWHKMSPRLHNFNLIFVNGQAFFLLIQCQKIFLSEFFRDVIPICQRSRGYI